MSTNYTQRGDVLVYSNSTGSTINSSDVVVVNDRVGVAVVDIADGSTGAVHVEGVFSLAKASEAINQGQAIYWDATAGNITLTSAGNTLAGYAFESTIAADPTIAIKLNG